MKAARWTTDQVNALSSAHKKAMAAKPVFCIGIDPGTHTGVAIWNTERGKFIHYSTGTIYEQLRNVEAFIKDHSWMDTPSQLVFEDARKRKKVPTDAQGNYDTSRLQGAGSVKRDSAIWQECCEAWAKKYNNFTWRGVAPNGKTNSLAKNKEAAKRNLEITGQVSEHALCAAFLVWKM